MSNNNELLTDDYVADLLAQEASDCSLKYSAMGMDAYRTNKKPANMMKPNTRFLRHIIKDTDNHNKALLAKEAAESKARLQDLERTEEIKRRKTNPNVSDIRRRQMGDIHAILGGKRRSRTEDEAGPSSRDSKRREKDRKSEREQDQDTGDLFTNRRSERSQHGRLSREDRRNRTDDDSRRSDRSRREHKRRDRSRNRDRDSEDEGRHGRSQRRRDRSRSPTRRRRSRSPRESKNKHRHRSPLDKKEDRKRKEEEQEEDSDVLEDLIGPAPPPKYRGRGTVRGSSGIDRRFSETYDPKTDIQMDEDEDVNPWDDAVEAFRDRQKLRQNQEQRLKAAGFADEQIQRASGTEEKSAENVQWSKAGEKRAWDVGKVIGADGVLQSED
ncbi:uncharacterized protein B0J16DRAFT_140144 [Fusarium flagelliforme]|uniref:Pre-mrna-splicing factor 38b n=1 Tax=Fusarium flagelliforme TaxID=2675880 RepID=A0A395N4D7_9HYPO|nr:uncharacterized protein B0J16DRAFT_140144 [Fusarium flagelliforme]KAH7185739.1 hypothetical protein B0J16DRAFT_140144 [Fusarium flagelliforme]RFN54982.1 pre-mrna-splicing factor 38b [Fusarium flagelliforme]